MLSTSTSEPAEACSLVPPARINHTFFQSGSSGPPRLRLPYSFSLYLINTPSPLSSWRGLEAGSVSTLTALWINPLFPGISVILLAAGQAKWTWFCNKCNWELDFLKKKKSSLTGGPKGLKERAGIRNWGHNRVEYRLLLDVLEAVELSAALRYPMRRGVWKALKYCYFII